MPARAFEAGDPVSGCPPGARAGSAWLLSSSSDIETGTELAKHLQRLLEILEPAVADPRELVRGGRRADWFCFTR